MKVWISKYAISSGLFEIEVEQSAGDNKEYVYPVRGERYPTYVGFALGRDAHETKAGAIEAANVMRDKKISSLTKKIAKLKKATFE